MMMMKACRETGGARIVLGKSVAFFRFRRLPPTASWSYLRSSESAVCRQVPTATKLTVLKADNTKGINKEADQIRNEFAKGYLNVFAKVQQLSKMAPITCAKCQGARAVIIRPKNRQKLCKSCFIAVFEQEVHDTIISNQLFYPGEKVAIGASGGKDSTVLASLMTTLNKRHGYDLDLLLLSVDEGIKGYRDDSLETVKRNAMQYDLPLVIIGYDELYGWTMDQVVNQIGKKGNCTYCGVFRRQALDRGAARLSINHVVTGHNADDVAETVMMNLLRGDLPRLARATSIVTSSDASDIKRSKPLKYAYEKEIVLYAHHKELDYFTTECIYSPEAFRGTARALIKNLERIRPSAILDVVRSGEDMARLAPQSNSVQATKDIPLDTSNRAKHQEGKETSRLTGSLDSTTPPNGEKGQVLKSHKQQMGRCERCGYLTSQTLCKACLLLDVLGRANPKTDIAVR